MSTISHTAVRVTIVDDDRIVVNGTPWPWWVELA